MRRLHFGKRHLVVLALALASCRESVPPKIEICIGDGVGGADCVEADGTQKYRLPSQLLNYWMTNEPDEANFTTWCYDGSPPATQAAMSAIKANVKTH